MRLLGYEVAPNHSDSILTVDPLGQGPALLFQPAESSIATGAIHLDLRPTDQAEVVRVALSLGARYAEIGQAGDESWVVLADPEGNCFCVLQSARDQDILNQVDPGTPSPVE